MLDAEPVRTFTGDRDRCAQVLDNLIANAVKFTGEGGHIQVTVAERGEFAVLEVGDDGPGIPVEEQALVFDRFARASGAAERAVPGAGLGLTVVKAIVEGHGGDDRGAQRARCRHDDARGAAAGLVTLTAPTGTRTHAPSR